MTALAAGAGFEAKELWRVKGDQPLGSLSSTPVQKDGYLYGMISFKRFARRTKEGACFDLSRAN